MVRAAPPKFLVVLAIHPKNLRFAFHHMRGFSFFAGRGFGPCFLKADIDGGVDDRAAVYLGSGEEHEFAFVVDAFGG